MQSTKGKRGITFGLSSTEHWTTYESVKKSLDFVHRLYFNKITTFRKLDLLPSSGKKGRTETLAAGPPGWASLRPGPASETLLFYWNLDDGRSPKNVFTYNAPSSDTFRLHLQFVKLNKHITLPLYRCTPMTWFSSGGSKFVLYSGDCQTSLLSLKCTDFSPSV
jgi:hypothetical protein